MSLRCWMDDDLESERGHPAIIDTDERGEEKDRDGVSSRDLLDFAGSRWVNRSMGDQARALRPFFSICSAVSSNQTPTRIECQQTGSSKNIFSFSFSFFLSRSRRFLSLSRSLSRRFVLSDSQKTFLKNNSSRRQHTDTHMRQCYLTIDLVFCA